MELGSSGVHVELAAGAHWPPRSQGSYDTTSPALLDLPYLFLRISINTLLNIHPLLAAALFSLTSAATSLQQPLHTL